MVRCIFCADNDDCLMIDTSINCNGLSDKRNCPFWSGGKRGNIKLQ